VILTKMVINSVASKLAKHFKLEKIMSYVFDDNELDEKTKELENRIKIIESIIVVNNKKEK
jgi:hypothetical protein